MHLLPHLDHFLTQSRGVALPANDTVPNALEGRADVAISRREARAGQGLMLPNPGAFLLVLFKGRHGTDHQAGCAFWAQAQIGFIQKTRRR